MNFTISLGDKAADKITKFTGIVIGRADYISGSNTYLLIAKDKNKTERPLEEWFDEDRLEIIKSGVYQVL